MILTEKEKLLYRTLAGILAVGLLSSWVLGMYALWIVIGIVVNYCEVVLL